MADIPQDPLNPQDPGNTEETRENTKKIKDDMERIVQKTSEMEYSFLRTRDATKALLETLTSNSEVTKRIETYGTQIKNSFIDINNLASRLGTDYIKIEQIEKRRKENLGLQTQMQTLQNNIIDEYNKKVENLTRTTSTGLQYELKNKNSILGANKENLNAETAIKNILDQVAKSGEKSLGDQEKQLYAIHQYLESLKEQEKVIKDIGDRVEDGNKQFTAMGIKATALKKIFDQLSFIPLLSSFMRFDIISDKFLISKKAGFAELGSQIKAIVTNPLFLLAMGILAAVAAMKALIKAALDFEKSIVTISNNLGFTRNATIGILDNFRRISDQNLILVKGLDSAFLSVKNQAAATAELQEILGTNAMFTNQMVQSQILLTKQMGLSKEEAAGIQKLSLLSGKSADDILQNAISQNKTAISYKKIISDISKVNAEISVMYKNNPDLIAKAVIEANKLGMSLEDTQKIAKSLLDFETSISGELEAELLTGRRFNFEKARALALDGKSVEAAKELVDQMGGLNGLTKLNVIQRERLAASIGLSAEELTKSAREQEVLNQLGFQNKSALEEQYELMRQRNDLAGMAALKAEAEKTQQGKVLLQDIARANLQQRFQESLERIKQIFTEVAAGPLIKILEGMARLLQNTTLLKGVFIALGALATMLAVKIAMATGGLSLLAGGLAALTIGGSLYSSGEEDQYTTPSPDVMSNRAMVAPTAFTPNQTVVNQPTPAQNREDLQTRLSSITGFSKPETPNTNTTSSIATPPKPETPNTTTTVYNTFPSKPETPNSFYTASNIVPSKPETPNTTSTASVATPPKPETPSSFYMASNRSTSKPEAPNSFYTASNRSAPKPEAPTAPNKNVSDLQNNLSSAYTIKFPKMEMPNSNIPQPNRRESEIQNTVAAVSPVRTPRPEVPYTTPNYATPQAAPSSERNDMAANTDKKTVIQNNIVLEVDGIKLTTAQKKIDVTYA